MECFEEKARPGSSCLREKTSDSEVMIEHTAVEEASCDKVIENSEMAGATGDVEDNRHRSAKRNSKSFHSRARSFESDEERKALLTLRRTQSLKRRDGSWDQQWNDQRKAEESRQSRPWTKPGRLNNSYWEKRVQAEHALPPRTPPPKRKLRGIQDGSITPVSREFLSETPPNMEDRKIISPISLEDRNVIAYDTNCSDDMSNEKCNGTTEAPVIDISPKLSDGNTAENTVVREDTPETCQQREDTPEKASISTPLSRTDSFGAGMQAIETPCDSKQEIGKHYIGDKIINQLETADEMDKGETLESPSEPEVFSGILADLNLSLSENIDIEKSNTCLLMEQSSEEVIETIEKVIETIEEVHAGKMNELFDPAESTLHIEKQEHEPEISNNMEESAGEIIEDVGENQEDKVNDLTDPDEPSLQLENLSPSPATNGTLIIAVQDMTTTLSDALNTITSTPPTPPPRAAPAVRTPLPPTPPPPVLDALTQRQSVDRQSLPSPPPEIIQESIKKVSSGGKLSDETPPRPSLPSNMIEGLEKKIETQYKKYPKVERTPPRPSPPKAPLPPERSNSLGRLKSVGPSPQNTPTQKRKIIIRAVRTPSPSPVPFETAKLKETGSYSSITSKSQNKVISGFQEDSMTYKASSQEELSIKSEEMDDISSQTTLVCGTFQAIPVNVDETLTDDEEQSESVANFQHENFPRSAHRKTFLESMLKAENVSKESSTKIDKMRNHKLKELKDLDEMKKHEEINLTLELEKKQNEVEEILKKKKEGEHFKRLEFEENRIIEENEKMKKAAEEKKKREEDDKRLHIEKEERLKQEEHKRQLLMEERNRRSDDVDAKARKEQLERKKEEERKIMENEERLRKEEEVKIQIGREQKFKELEEQRRKSKEEKKRIEEERKVIHASKEEQNAFENEQLKKLVQPKDSCELNARTNFEEEIIGRDVHHGRKSPKPKAVEQYEDMVSSKFNQNSSENTQRTTEKRNTQDELTLKIEELDDQHSISDPEGNGLVETPKEPSPVKCDTLEKPKEASPPLNTTSEMTKVENRMLQKPKVPTENQIFRDISNDNSFSVSRRWKDVNTGHVKDRANTYLKPDENQNFQSPKITRKIFKPSSWFKKDQDHRNNNLEVSNVTNYMPASQEKSLTQTPIGQVNKNVKAYTNGNVSPPPIKPDCVPSHNIKDALKDIKPDTEEDTVAPWRRSDNSKERRQADLKSPTLNLMSVSVTPSLTRKTVSTQVSEKGGFKEETIVRNASSVTKNEEVMKESCFIENKFESFNQSQSCVETDIKNVMTISVQESKVKDNQSESDFTYSSEIAKLQTECEYKSSNVFETNIENVKQNKNYIVEDHKEVGIRLSTERSNSPKTKTKKEAEEELDETIKQLEQHVESLGDSTKSPPKTELVTSTADMVTQAAASVKDAAGAVREVAQNLLKAITPEIHPETRSTDEIPVGKVKNVQAVFLSPETRRRSNKSPQDLQDVQESITGKVKDTASMWCQIAEENEKSEKKSQEIPGRKFTNMFKPKAKNTPEDSDSEEDSLGYEDDFSVGIDLPLALDSTSGNVTPIPTTGELEELSSVEELTVVEEIILDEVRPKSQQESRATPLKSLLKKPSFDNDDTSSSSSDSDSDDGKVSPKKVHFSEIDQVKLMSQESLASMATSEGNEVTVLPVTLCTTIMSTTPTPAIARIVTNKMASKQEELERALGDMDTKTAEHVHVRKEYIK
eukprot:GFUD01005631.1.p1 GENE.GFUD01005631.1~~GFUD01005631.1.p1  ORF type:complete len:1719 (+),score=531.92 GFUD01005631.1:116-5272(+)